MQKYKISFEGQNVFVGIDVHLKSWHVTAITESGFKHTLAIKPNAKILFDTLNRRFPDAHFIAAYEAGFTGFATYYSLMDAGIETIAVNAADIPTSQKEQLMKTDAVESEKIARSLRAGELHGIYIEKREYMDDCNLVRLRSRIVKDLSRQRNRTLHLLHTQGVEIPERFCKKGSRWSCSFMRWLEEDVQLLSETKRTLQILILTVQNNRKMLLDITREIRQMSKSEVYKPNYELLCSVPGIALITAMSLLTELDNDIPSRFSNERQFVSYLGLIPTCHDSGEKKVNGEKTNRGNKQLGPLITEASWTAIRKDVELAACYSAYCQRMEPQKAIIKVSRKLACKTFAVLKTKQPYVLP